MIQSPSSGAKQRSGAFFSPYLYILYKKVFLTKYGRWLTDYSGKPSGWNFMRKENIDTKIGKPQTPLKPWKTHIIFKFLILITSKVPSIKWSEK